MNNSNDDILTVGLLWKTLKENIPFIALSVTLITSVTIIYSLSVTPIFESNAIMTQSSAMKSSQSSSSSISEVASFVSGLDSSQQNSEEKIAITRILSKEYFNKRIYQNSFLLNCMYMICDISNFDDVDKFYSEEFKEGNFSKPPFMVAYRKFRASYRVFSNIELISFTFQHESPEVAYKFLDWLIIDGNNYVRDIEIAKSQASINYLSSKLETTRNLELQKLIGALIQKDIQKMSLSQNSDNFAFEMIDQPIVPSDRIFPKRSLMASVAFMLGLVLSASLAILFKYLNYFPWWVTKINHFLRK